MKAMEIRKDYRYIFESLQGVATDDKTRYAMTFIYHDEERNKLVSTNGKTMLIWSIPETGSFEDLRAFINGVKFLKYDKGTLFSYEDDMTCPTWWRAVPNTEKHQHWKLAYGTFSNKNARKNQMRLYASLLLTGLYFNYDYIEPVKVAFSDIYIRKDTACVAETNDGMFKFVMMPMQVSEEMERIA